MFARLFYTTAVSLALFCACSDSSKNETQDLCTRGLVQSCTTADGCSGESTCVGSPTFWGKCVCTQPSAPDAGPPARLLLGNACKGSGDCATGASCLRPSGEVLFGGAPPEGVCVASCGADGDCSSFANGICVDVTDPLTSSDSAGSGLCFERCALGASKDQKCQGGSHVACTPLADSGSSEAYCRPVCTTDADCPSGACDPARSVCVRNRTVDRTFGRACGTSSSGGEAGNAGAGGEAGSAGAGGEAGAGASPNDDASVTCDSQCVTLNDSSSMCSRRCVFGDSNECAPSSGGLRRGACAFVTPGGSIGDLGYCAELCDCADDCAEASFACDAFDDSTLERVFARKGVCTPPELTKHALACAP